MWKLPLLFISQRKFHWCTRPRAWARALSHQFPEISRVSWNSVPWVQQRPKLPVINERGHYLPMAWMLRVARTHTQFSPVSLHNRLLLASWQRQLLPSPHTLNTLTCCHPRSLPLLLPQLLQPCTFFCEDWSLPGQFFPSFGPVLIIVKKILFCFQNVGSGR